MAPARKKPESGSWLSRQVSIGNFISVGAVIFTGAGFYYGTSSTLAQQHNQIAAIEQKLKDNDKLNEKQQSAVVAERATLRQEMSSRAEKTAEGIAELNKQTAVLSTQLTSIKEELVKVGSQLAVIGTATAGNGKR